MRKPQRNIYPKQDTDPCPGGCARGHVTPVCGTLA